MTEGLSQEEGEQMLPAKSSGDEESKEITQHAEQSEIKI